MTGIVGMERFMKRRWFVCVIEFTACAKPLLMAEMIMFYKCKSSPQFERNHAVHVTCQCFTNGTSPLWFTQRSLCIHPESEPHQASFASKVRPVLSVDENELSHPSRWSRLSWEMNFWLFKARKLWCTNTAYGQGQRSVGLVLYSQRNLQTGTKTETSTRLQEKGQ